MADLLIGQVGTTGVGDGSSRSARGGRYGAQAVMQSHASNFDAVDRGNMFMCSMQAAAALGTGLTATAVTFTLHNPSGSGKNLVIVQTTLAVVVGTTAGFVVYAVNDTPAQAAPATTTALTIRNCNLGAGSASVARVFSVATLPAAPVATRVLAGIISTTPGGVHSIVDMVNGGIILPENTSVTIQGITTNATGVISMMWEEVSP